MRTGAGVTLARLVDCSGGRLRQTQQRGGERGRDRIPFRDREEIQSNYRLMT
jgi:hypothetical protein